MRDSEDVINAGGGGLGGSIDDGRGLRSDGISEGGVVQSIPLQPRKQVHLLEEDGIRLLLWVAGARAKYFIP